MTNQSLFREYIAKHPNSQTLHVRAKECLVDGITRDVVRLDPFPIRIASGQGAFVTDVDNNKLVDVVMGNGALILGHGNEEVVNATVDAIHGGFHLGSCSQYELEWAEIVKALVPSAEVVRFTNSGSEATSLAIRLARAYTGRSRILKFHGHFHGWLDGLAYGSILGHVGADSAGIPNIARQSVSVLDIIDAVSIERALKEDQLAAVILEPSGGKAGFNPLPNSSLAWLRSVTRKYGVLLIFDEIVTGFRWAPGGVQETAKIIPDLCTLGKILGGGVGCGAVVGRADIMRTMAYEHNSSIGDVLDESDGRVHHGGTFSGNPLAAAAGIETLRSIADGQKLKETNLMANWLRGELQLLLDAGPIHGCVWGDASAFHVKLYGSPSLADKLRIALANHGVLMRRFTGLLSVAHTHDVTRELISRFKCALHSLHSCEVGE